VTPAFDARPVPGHQIQPSIVSAQNRMQIVIAARVEFSPESPAMNQLAGFVAIEQLQTIASHRVKAISPDEQPLRTTPAQSGGDDLELIVNAVRIGVFQAAYRRSITNQQSPVSIEREIVAAAGQFGVSGAVDVKAGWESKSRIEKDRGCASRQQKPKGETQN
jgi:hypothetical protein